jgi:hypothetical protein
MLTSLHLRLRLVSRAFVCTLQRQQTSRQPRHLAFKVAVLPVGLLQFCLLRVERLLELLNSFSLLYFMLLQLAHPLPVDCFHLLQARPEFISHFPPILPHLLLHLYHSIYITLLSYQ